MTRFTPLALLKHCSASKAVIFVAIMLIGVSNISCKPRDANHSEVASMTSTPDHLVYCFGEVLTNETLSHEFNIPTHGLQNEVLTGIRNSCSCVKTQVMKNGVRGDDHLIVMELNSGTKQCRLAATSNLYVNGEKQPKYTIKMYGDVYEAMALNTNVLTLSEESGNYLGSLIVQNNSGAPWEGVDLVSPLDGLTGKASLKAGDVNPKKLHLRSDEEPAIRQVWELACSIPKEGIPKSFESLTATISASNIGIYKRIPLQFISRSTWKSFPNTIVFGDVSVGSSEKRSATIFIGREIDKSDIEDLSIDRLPDNVTATFAQSKEAGKVTLDVVLKNIGLKGVIEHELSIVSKSKGTRYLTIQIIGSFVL